MNAVRRPSFGAEVAGGGTRFAALADASEVSVRVYDASGSAPRDIALSRIEEDRFEAVVDGVGHGALYRFVIAGRELPDPYARFLPHGVHGPAMVVEPRHVFRAPRIERPLREHVIYELHVGTFTVAGTYAGAAERLTDLVDLGVTTLELMPLSAFAGSRGWGYDGVALYAPFAGYGTPDELRAFIDSAHELGLSLLLDVVYNHFGPAGNYLTAYSERYFTAAERTPWGDAPDFAHAPMRRYVLDNARYWLEEFRFDGLRLDATHALCDRSSTHVLRELASSLADLAPKPLLIAEDERNDPSLVTRLGLDAVWADDFHHQLHVTLNGERDGYYAAYEPGVAGVARAIERGWLYEGQHSIAKNGPRGAPAQTLDAASFVYCLQNHDQIGNRAFGERLHHLIPEDAYLAVSLLFLCLPMTPLLFMGQEWAASSPFLYFTDHDEELGHAIRVGRSAEFAHFGAFAAETTAVSLPDPQAKETFERSQLDWSERSAPEHARVLELYRAALALRRSDPVLRDGARERLRAEAHGSLLVVRRWSGRALRVILVNFGDAALPLAELSALHGIGSARLLLSSRPLPEPSALPARSAAVFAGNQGSE